MKPGRLVVLAIILSSILGGAAEAATPYSMAQNLLAAMLANCSKYFANDPAKLNACKQNAHSAAAKFYEQQATRSWFRN
jgi:hypothetical protein